MKWFRRNRLNILNDAILWWLRDVSLHNVHTVQHPLTMSTVHHQATWSQHFQSCWHRCQKWWLIMQKFSTVLHGWWDIRWYWPMSSQILTASPFMLHKQKHFILAQVSEVYCSVAGPDNSPTIKWNKWWHNTRKKVSSCCSTKYLRFPIISSMHQQDFYHFCGQNCKRSGRWSRQNGTPATHLVAGEEQEKMCVQQLWQSRCPLTRLTTQEGNLTRLTKTKTKTTGTPPTQQCHTIEEKQSAQNEEKMSQKSMIWCHPGIVIIVLWRKMALVQKHVASQREEEPIAAASTTGKKKVVK